MLVSVLNGLVCITWQQIGLFRFTLLHQLSPVLPPVLPPARCGQAFVVVGDSNGHVGLGVKCAKEVRCDGLLQALLSHIDIL